MQLRYVLELMDTGLVDTQARTCLLLRLTGVRTLRDAGDGRWLCRTREGRLFMLSPIVLAANLDVLDWVNDIPRLPVRPAEVAGKKGVDALLHGVGFGTFLMLENYYQGFVHTERRELLEEMARLLYPGLGEVPGFARWGALLWFASVKGVLAERFADFFVRVPGDGETPVGPPDVEGLMNAEIRALTGGDVTKEREVLALDCWRALTELNEKAREYKDHKKG